MTKTIEDKRKALIHWLKSSDDSDLIDAMHRLKNKAESDFDKAFSAGLTGDEFVDEMKKRIKDYPWKK